MKSKWERERGFKLQSTGGDCLQQSFCRQMWFGLFFFWYFVLLLLGRALRNQNIQCRKEFGDLQSGGERNQTASLYRFTQKRLIVEVRTNFSRFSSKSYKCCWMFLVKVSIFRWQIAVVFKHSQLFNFQYIIHFFMNCKQTCKQTSRLVKWRQKEHRHGHLIFLIPDFVTIFFIVKQWINLDVEVAYLFLTTSANDLNHRACAGEHVYRSTQNWFWFPHFLETPVAFLHCACDQRTKINQFNWINSLLALNLGSWHFDMNQFIVSAKNTN